MPIRLLTLAASFRPHSLNKKLLKLASTIAAESGATISEFDFAHADIPVYREDATSIPTGAKHFIDALLSADGLLLASPEYNWSIPGGLKNLIDWASVDKRQPFKGRTCLLLCASPSTRGGIMGLQQLSQPLAHLGMHVYPHLVALGDAEIQLAEGSAMSSKDQQFLQQCVTDFVRSTKAFKDAKH